MAEKCSVYQLINKKEDLLILSNAYKKGEIQLNKSKIAKSLNIDRKTVTNYLNGKVPKKTRVRKKYLDSFRETIIELINDKNREFDYIDHLYRFMKREYFIKCNRVTFNRYIRKDESLNKLFKEKSNNSFTVRFETDRGQQVQFDLKEKVKLLTKTGEEITCYIPTLTLGWSRYNYRKLVLDTKTETLINFLAEAFEFFNGVPEEIVIDNLKAFVEKARYKNNEALLNPLFEEFCKDYGIKVKPCMPRRPQTIMCSL